MAKKPSKTFVGINYSWKYYFSAKTKKEGGVKLFRALKKDGHRASNPVALAKYVGQLCYSPTWKRLWYRITLWDNEMSRVVYPSQVPEALWGGIEEAEPPREPSSSGTPYSIRSKEKAELSLEKFRARAGRGK